MNRIKSEMMKRVLSDAMRHHIEADNERLRAALRIIEDIGEGGNSIASLRNCARIARNALVSAATEFDLARHHRCAFRGDDVQPEKPDD
jgi:hypothetical protein